MRRFVQPRRRTPSRRVIVRTEAKKTSGFILFLHFHWQKIIGSLLVISILYLLFFYNRNPIQRVTFSQSTYDTFVYDPLYQKISDSLIGKGYYKQKYRQRGSMVQDIKKHYPIVKNIRPIAFEQGTLTVDIVFSNPDFITITSDNTERLTYRNTFLPYISGTTLGITGLRLGIALENNILQQYSGGIFWAISSQDLVKAISSINFLDAESVSYTYYPGREKLQITADNGSYTVSLDEAQWNTTLEQRKNIIPYMPSEVPYSVNLSDPDRIIIKQ